MSEAAAAANSRGGRQEEEQQQQRYQGLRLDSEDERLVEWRRHRLRSSPTASGSWHLRRSLEMAARTLLLGVVLLVTPGEFIFCFYLRGI